VAVKIGTEKDFEVKNTQGNDTKWQTNRKFTLLGIKLKLKLINQKAQRATIQ
jgi:hypothetical protein